MTRKSQVLAVTAIILLATAITVTWKNMCSSTRIAFVNYQPISLGQIGKANDNSFIKIENLPVGNMSQAGRYDMIFVNGMGLRITDEQRQHLQSYADNGGAVLSTYVTNPQNMIVSVDSVDTEFLKQYLQGGGRENYRSMLNYVRKFIDRKKLFVNDPKDPIASPNGLFYHPDVRNNANENLYFNTLAEYRNYLNDNGLVRDNAPEIILTGQMGVPDELVRKLEASGNIVYPITSIQRAIDTGIADSISPSAMVNMAHGRMGDRVVRYLERMNIPLFAPLNVNRDYGEWMEDKQGMSGGFLSQSIVTPEIDGAIRPWTLFAQYDGNDGVPEIKAIPGRLEEFVETVNRHIALRRKPNRDKKVAIFYFKGPGQNALVAEGMEVAPSLYNLLMHMKRNGYSIDNLPDSADKLELMLNERGKVFGSYDIGEMQRFVAENEPQLVSEAEYAKWTETALGKDMGAETENVDGAFPGSGLKTADGRLALACVRLGNIVLIPQTAAGTGDDDFKIVHGTGMAPPHAYVASYLWARYGFGIDALIHFGAHGSLEFTPRKQVALGSRDWSDRLIGSIPHFYIYSTSNVGEAMISKRRSYACIINYLTPPFMESDVRGIYKKLSDAITDYNKESGMDTPDSARVDAAARLVARHTVKLGIHRELRLDSTENRPYTSEEIARIENFAEELANERITGAHYVIGTAYSADKLMTTTLAMTVDPIAYSLYALDKSRGLANGKYDGTGARFTHRYLTPARKLVTRLLAENREVTDKELCDIAGISRKELDDARRIVEESNGTKDLLSRMMVMESSMTVGAPTAKLSERKEPSASRMKHMMKATGMSPDKAIEMARRMGADTTAIAKMRAAMTKGGKGNASKSSRSSASSMMMPQYSREEMDKAVAINEIERAVTNAGIYYDALRNSPEKELDGVMNALNGGFIPPASGGDPVLNPMILPTGRNMYAVNAEETPSATAWEKGKDLAENTIRMYRKAHGDSLPRKVSYTLWSSEFIATEGATIAQILYMLGVEPLRDPFGRVTDLRLIPSEELVRPRIDVVVQTSGQLRDLAASRLLLISRAVEMAAEAGEDKFPNFVADGAVMTEKHLVDKGVSPKEARELSTARVFGGVDGNYGSGIQEMVESGDRWEDDGQIAETYMHNMGALYGSEAEWEKLRDFAFEAALTGTDVVVQPRQSNTWGALSLDHVYEFMGGMNLAVRKVTGKDPDAYLADYRNRNNTKMQEVKEAIGVESRTTILNPAYIREKMKGGAGDASAIADVVRNTYGWNVMKPDAIDNELWDNIYDTYIADRHGLGIKEYFTSVSPAALEEITAVMLETVRKGMWKTSEERIKALAELHTEIVSEYRPSCSGFVCDNAKLRQYIYDMANSSSAADYNKAIGQIRAENTGEADGMVMEKNELNRIDKTVNHVSGSIIAMVVAIGLSVIFVIVSRRHNNNEE